MTKAWLILLVLFGVKLGSAQNQLVLLKGEKVLARYKEGEDITYKLKKEANYKTGYLIAVEDFFIVTSKDTIPLINVDKIDLRRKSYDTRLNVAGAALVTIGIGYFVIDQFNSVVVRNQGFNESEGSWLPAAIATGIGLPLMAIKRKKHHIGWKYKLRSASPGSPFYKY